MASGRDDILGPLELSRYPLTLLAGNEAFEPRHVDLRLVLDVVVYDVHQRIQKWLKLGVGRGHVLDLCEVHFHLESATYQQPSGAGDGKSTAYTLMLFRVRLDQIHPLLA